MDFRRRIIWTTVAIGAALTINALSSAGAQAPGANREPPPPYRPAAAAKDLRAVLFNWTWYMGMLRGVDEHELIVSLEYQGKGTIQVDGQPCTLTKYRVSTSYQAPGQRVQYTCARPNGQTHSAIEVVSGQYAWNEDIAGAEIIPGKGKTTPMPGSVQERLIRLWAGPQGAPKAAIAGAAETTELGPNPVEDPEVLVEPWVMTPRTLRLNPNSDAGLLPERGNCEVYELKDITSQIRH